MANILNILNENGTYVGIPSIKGTNGITPHIGPNGNWWTGVTDTGVKATTYITDTEYSTADEGINKITFSDGTAVQIQNGSKGSQGEQGPRGPQGPVGEGTIELQVNSAIVFTKNFETDTELNDYIDSEPIVGVYLTSDVVYGQANEGIAYVELTSPNSGHHTLISFGQEAIQIIISNRSVHYSVGNIALIRISRRENGNVQASLLNIGNDYAFKVVGTASQSGKEGFTFRHAMGSWGGQQSEICYAKSGNVITVQGEVLLDLDGSVQQGLSDYAIINLSLRPAFQISFYNPNDSNHLYQYTLKTNGDLCLTTETPIGHGSMLSLNFSYITSDNIYGG